MDLADAEARLGNTLPERHRQAMQDASDPVHEWCDFWVPESPYSLLRWVGVNELLHTADSDWAGADDRDFPCGHTPWVQCVAVQPHRDSSTTPMSAPKIRRRPDEDSIALEARHLAALTPAERAAIFIDLDRTMEAILAGLSEQERGRRRALARELDPRPIPWWKNLRRSARPTSDDAS